MALNSFNCNQTLHFVKNSHNNTTYDYNEHHF